MFRSEQINSCGVCANLTYLSVCHINSKRFAKQLSLHCSTNKTVQTVADILKCIRTGADIRERDGGKKTCYETK